MPTRTVSLPDDLYVIIAQRAKDGDVHAFSKIVQDLVRKGLESEEVQK
jgi:metal-responsive CopG/Arc/MetJ family transcriptional regulator